MNKGILYGVAAVLGIGAAFLVFPKGDGADGATPDDAPQAGGAEQPKEPSKMVHDPESKRRATRPEGTGMPTPGSPKDTEFMRKQAALRGSAIGVHASSAAPAWQAVGMELNTAAPDLAAKCRAMSTEIRMASKSAELKVPELVEKERALLEEVRGQGSASAASLERIETLIAELEAAPAPPVDAGTTPAIP